MANVKSANQINLDAEYYREPNPHEMQQAASGNRRHPDLSVHWDSTHRHTLIDGRGQEIYLDDREVEWLITTLTEMRHSR